jgi:subtilase family serine protease
MTNKKLFAVLVAFLAAASAFVPVGAANAAYRFADFQGRPPVHVFRSAEKAPSGVTPAEIKKIYNLPAAGGKGTIAIIDAYNDANIESDLAVFDKQFNLPSCTAVNGCFEKHTMASSTASNSEWAMETSLDVEWAHAIAPDAKLLLVQAKTQSGANLLDAIDYAAARKDVVAVSMSWGGPEFSDELSYDTHFAAKASSSIAFFASSGDNGAGASWPASSPYVIGVGGTALELASSGALIAESAWSGSGGGVSAYEKEPGYQSAYKISKANGMRAIPDVSYDADPKSGYPIYVTGGVATTGGAATTAKKAKGAWYTVGGTSAGAPQWAAIRVLGGTAGLDKFYADKASTSTLKYFRDITSGSNGTCKYYCDARKRYDYVTGLGSPQTTKF